MTDAYFENLAGFSREPVGNDDEFIDEDDLDFAASQPRWVDHPGIQLTLIAAGVGLCIGGGTVFVNQMLGTFPAAQKEEPSSVSKLFDEGEQDHALGDIKADRAFGNSLSQLQTKPDAKSDTNAIATPSGTTQPTPSATPSVPVRSSPPPVAVYRPPASSSLPQFSQTTARPSMRPATTESVRPLSPSNTEIKPEMPTEPTSDPEPVSVERPPLANSVVNGQQNTPVPATPSTGYPLLPGTQTTAVIAAPMRIMAGQTFRTGIALSAPLLSATGEIALPTGTRLVIEAANIAPENGISALPVVGVIQPDGSLHTLPPEALLVVGAEDWIAEPQSSTSSRRSFNLGAALVTGVTGALDLDDNDILTGTALETIRQLTEPEDQPQQPTPETVVIPAGTSVTVHVNQAISIPAPAVEIPLQESLPAFSAPADRPLLPPDQASVSQPESSPSTPPSAMASRSSSAQTDINPPAPPPAPRQSNPAPNPELPLESEPAVLVADLPDSPPPSVPSAATEPVLTLRAGFGQTLDYLDDGAIILKAWLDNPAIAEMDFDTPLATETASVLHLQSQSPGESLLTVVTRTAEGQRQVRTYRVVSESETATPKTLLKYQGGQI